MSWTTRGTADWSSDSADGSVIARGARVWPAGANAVGDIGFMSLVMAGTGSPSVHSDWTLIASSVDADTAGSGVRSTYLYAFVYAGAAPNLAWHPATNYCVNLQTYRHSSQVTFTFGTALSEKNADGTTHTLTGGIASLGTDSLIICVASNGRAQNYSDTHSTTPTTGSSTADTTTAPSTTAWIERSESGTIGSPFSGSGLFDCVLNSGGTGNILTTLTAATQGTVLAIAIKPGITPLVTVTNPVERKSFNGASGSKNVSFSGGQTGANETIQIQVEKASDSSVVIAWTDFAVAPTGGVWSGSISIPRGGWYNARFRKKISTSVETQTTTRWGVGLIVGPVGQSHLNYWGSVGSGTPDDRASQVALGTTTITALSGTGAGRVAFANALIALCDCPVTIIDRAVDGTPITYWYTLGGGPTAEYIAWAARVTASGGELSVGMLWEGDADAQAATSKSAYMTLLGDLEAKMQADFGAPLFVSGVLGRYGAGANTPWDDVRRAHVEFSFADPDRRGLVTLDQPQDGDQQHFPAASHVVFGGRLANLIADWCGVTSSGVGPVVASAKYNGTKVAVTLTHDNGTDFTPASGITGFSVLDNGSATTISSAVRYSPTVVLLTLSASLAGPVAVRYGYGAYPTVSGAVFDNTTFGMPLYSTSSNVAATLDSTGPLITGPSGSAGASTSSKSVAEGVTAVHTFTANESVTWDLNGGADVLLYSINPTTGALVFLAPRNFEVPGDGGSDNTYIVGVRATDPVGNATTQTLTTTITNVNEAPTFSGTISIPALTVGLAMSPYATAGFFGDPDAGDTAAYSAAGSWPAGVAPNSSTGVISGTPTVSGTYAGLQVLRTDSGALSIPSNTFSITVNAPVTPVITGPAGAAGASSININFAESTTALGTWTATNGGTWSISGGADAAQVQISGGGVVTFLALNDYENPDDAGANRVYNFTVQNVGAGGTTTQDVAATMTNVTELPGAPTIGTATAGNATVTIPFTPPSAGSAPSVIDYTVTLSPGGATKVVSASPATFTSADGVVNGTAYTGSVTARNSDGTGSASAASNAVTPAAVAYTCSILDWVLPTGSQHSIGEQWNISFHSQSSRALVAYAPNSALVAGVNGSGQASRNLVVSSVAFVPGTTYAWLATHPTNPTWFACGLATAA